LTERENESGVKVRPAQPGNEGHPEGLTMQQTMLNEILGLLQPAAGAAASAAGAGAGGVVDPAAPPQTGGMPPRPSAIPPSPGEYYDRARNYYFRNEYDLAITALEDAIKRFPDAPQAARAQMLIGESYYKSGKYKEGPHGVHGHAHELQGPGRAAGCDVPPGHGVRSAGPDRPGAQELPAGDQLLQGQHRCHPCRRGIEATEVTYPPFLSEGHDMGSVNKAILVGNLGRDAEMRFTSGGTPVATVSLATTERYNDREGNKKEDTQWHRIVIWGKTAESLHEYLTKGQTDLRRGPHPDAGVDRQGRQARQDHGNPRGPCGAARRWRRR
jgi:hypothetical protein